MKTTLLIILIFFAYQISIAQFVINSSFNPVPGDIYKMRYADTTGILQGQPGANQNWNFSNLTALPDSSVTTYVSPSATPYGSSFPTATVASFHQDMTYYSYYHTSNSLCEYIGYGEPLGVVTYTNPETILQYPLSYGQSFSDSFYGSGTNSGYTAVTSGTSTTTYDAYGTITLPSGTSSVSRLKLVSISYDTLYYMGFPISTDYSIDTSYEWLKSNYKFPIFTIYYYYSTTSMSNTKTVGYVVNSATIGIHQINSNIPLYYSLSQNYPNPFNPNTNIKFQIKDSRYTTLKIYDILGKEIETLVNEKLSPGSYSVDWNASQYPSGVYFYRLQSGDFVDTKRMMLIK